MGLSLWIWIHLLPRFVLAVWVALFHSVLFWPLRKLLSLLSADPYSIDEIKPSHIQQWLGGEKVVKVRFFFFHLLFVFFSPFPWSYILSPISFLP